MMKSRPIYYRLLGRVALPLSLIFVASGASALVVTPASWELASEFSDAANPAGVWRYGVKPSATGAFTVMTHQISAWAGNIKGWDTPASVLHNVNPAPYVVANPGGPIKTPAHGLTMHPGPRCEYSVVRFTAPLAGKYRISGQFFGLDPNGGGTTTDVLIYQNSAQIFTGLVNVGGSSPTANFLITSGLKVGDTIDFEVGCGVNKNYGYDTTGLNAVITKL